MNTPTRPVIRPVLALRWYEDALALASYLERRPKQKPVAGTTGSSQYLKGELPCQS